MSVDEVLIPEYTRKQETFNALSHFLGIFVAMFVLGFDLVKLIKNEISLFYFFGLLIFALSMFLVYGVSSLYHYMDKDNYYKKLFRVLDHCMIYLLIAGTYTPICFVLMKEHVVGLVMLIIQWSGALLGIILNAFFFNNKVAGAISFILYVVMGWLVLFTGGFIYIKTLSFAYILAGGIAYTIGAIIYGIGHKKIGYHCIFHVFVLVSTILQMVGVLALF